MTIERARAIVSDVAAQRIRWGKFYDGSEHGWENILDALVVLAKHDNERLAAEAKADEERETAEREEITKLNRQLAAAKARETKLRNDLKKYRGEEVSES
jgi:hypothetical protein